MEKVIKFKDGYTIERMFEDMGIGDIVKVPYEKSKHSAIKAEQARQHKYAKNRGVKITSLDPMFRVSGRENKGFTTVIRIK